MTENSPEAIVQTSVSIVWVKDWNKRGTVLLLGSRGCRGELVGARSDRFFADPELLDITPGIIPAIASKFHTVLFIIVVGLPFIPVLHEAVKSRKT